jgi:hypothetical protein
MLCFFNLAGATYDPDVEGLELPSIVEARLEAARYIGEVIRDRPNLVWAGEEVRVEVTDARQLILFTIIVLGVDAPSSPRAVGRRGYTCSEDKPESRRTPYFAKVRNGSKAFKPVWHDKGVYVSYKPTPVELLD